MIPLEKKYITVRTNRFIRETKNLNSQEYINDFLSINWKNELELEKLDINRSFELLEEKINKIVDNHFPLKKVSEKKKNLKIKPWMTNTIINEIKKTR